MTDEALAGEDPPAEGVDVQAVGEAARDAADDDALLLLCRVASNWDRLGGHLLDLLLELERVEVAEREVVMLRCFDLRFEERGLQSIKRSLAASRPPFIPL